MENNTIVDPDTNNNDKDDFWDRNDWNHGWNEMENDVRTEDAWREPAAVDWEAEEARVEQEDDRNDPNPVNATPVNQIACDDQLRFLLTIAASAVAVFLFGLLLGKAGL